MLKNFGFTFIEIQQNCAFTTCGFFTTLGNFTTMYINAQRIERKNTTKNNIIPLYSIRAILGYAMDMLCAKHGFAQSRDCPAQTLDPWFVCAVSRLHQRIDVISCISN